MKVVTILGLGPSRKECEFPPSDLWGTVDCLLQEDLKDRKFDKVFAFDGKVGVVNGKKIENVVLQKAIEIAISKGIPLVSNHEYATEPFPSRDIVKKFKTSYFMPTLSYAIAYALYLGYERIYIYGIDGGPQWWYQLGKPHMTFWIGYAIALGVQVIMGRGSLSWAYRPGLDKLPMAFLIDEYEKLYIQMISAKEKADEVSRCSAN